MGRTSRIEVESSGLRWEPRTGRPARWVRRATTLWGAAIVLLADKMSRGLQHVLWFGCTQPSFTPPEGCGPQPTLTPWLGLTLGVAVLVWVAWSSRPDGRVWARVVRADPDTLWLDQRSYPLGRFVGARVQRAGRGPLRRAHVELVGPKPLRIAADRELESSLEEVAALLDAACRQNGSREAPSVVEAPATLEALRRQGVRT